MKFTINDLARFGMDRVGVHVMITPSDSGGQTHGVQVTTTPYKNKEVIAAVQSMVGDAMENDNMIATALMTSDGSLTCTGFTAQARGRLCTILGDFSRTYRKLLDYQEQSLADGLTVAAREAATYMLYHEPVNGFGVKMHFCIPGEDLNTLREEMLANREMRVLYLDQLTGIIENADFLAWHHQRLEQALQPLVIEELKKQLPVAREELTQRLAAFDRMALKLDKSD